MNKLSIKVIVAGRTYPLTVNESERPKVEKAADDINKAVSLLQDNYAVKDMQDLLAMTALQLATKSPSSISTNQKNDCKEIEDSLGDLLKEIENL
jgi:cell division protein ZapA (FtsZ GTPase activity inhibitor)